MTRWLIRIAACTVLFGAAWLGTRLDRPAPIAPVVEQARPEASRLHVLVAGDSVQVGGVKGEITKCVVVPHGKMMVVEISTRPPKAGKGETK